jgi:magnesium chelatase family protein
VAVVLASIATFAIDGLDSREVTVEVDVRRGLPVFSIVGLPDRAVREARERVRAAISNSGLEFPLQRLTANLAPASVRKAGPSFDLALAVAVLAASDQLPRDRLRRYAVCGELSLGGALRPVRGALSISHGARTAGYDRLIVPPENAAEAALVDGIDVFPVPSLDRLSDLVHERWEPDPAEAPPEPPAPRDALDLADVRGQADARRAVEIAAAGGHNLLMIGPPGAGKTMLARRLPGILPPPTFEEALEITRVHSVAGLASGRLATQRPFRAPHHTISASGLVGGGAVPRPGEVTLAHRGVLFLDELTELARPSLEALRQPLEDRHVEVVRGQRSLRFPASVTLVAACNPCPCGRAGADCDCPPQEVARYRRRLSGPLLDRIDLVCQLGPTPAEALVSGRAAESSATVRKRVVAARSAQEERLLGSRTACNGEMGADLTRRTVPLDEAVKRRLVDGHAHRALTGRGHDKVLRIARTIADLAGEERVRAEHVDEALAFRLDAGPA